MTMHFYFLLNAMPLMITLKPLVLHVFQGASRDKSHGLLPYCQHDIFNLLTRICNIQDIYSTSFLSFFIEICHNSLSTTQQVNTSKRHPNLTSLNSRISTALIKITRHNILQNNPRRNPNSILTKHPKENSKPKV